MSVMTLQELTEQVAEANRVLAAVGLSTGAIAGHGHASMRMPDQPDRFVMKGRGAVIDVLAKATADDMVVCDLDAFTVERKGTTIPAFEVMMHACIYRTHPEVQTIAHTHARYCAVLSVLQNPIVPMCQEGIPLVRRPLPVYPHVAPVITEVEGMEVARLLGDSKAILLEGHGATTTGATLEEAVMNMINLEEQAKMNWYARCAAGPDYRRIPEQNLDELSNLRVAPTLPHFKDLLAENAAMEPREGGRRGGVYAYYAAMNP
jgi:ribulose-5-phosphate 4-epimerase/fuculose-1-phosphate aldolase